MRLESITLHGFKSFGEKTVVKVLPGITGIVGPNGCGKCLVGNTPVVLADGRVMPIGALVETELERAPLLQEFDDGVAAFNVGAGIDVLSLDPATLRLEPRPVEAFIRRTAPPFLLRVRTRSGREVVTTHYHPFFSLEKGHLKVLTAEQLVAGVRIAAPRCLPVKPRSQETLADAVLRHVGPQDRLYAPHSASLQAWLATASRKAGNWSRLARLAGLKQSLLRNVMSGQPVRVGAIAKVATSLDLVPPPPDHLAASGGTTIRLPQEFDGRLARFLGYLIAEGRNTGSGQVWFVNNDPAVTAEFARLAQEVFDVVPRRFQYKPRATDTLIFSRALSLLLDRVFGFRIDGGSAAKVIPTQVWESSDQVVGEFLSGLFEGDAFVHAARDSKRATATPYLEYVTASRRLANEVVTLLLRLGVFALVRPKDKYAANTRARRRRTYYCVYVYGVQQMQRLATRIRFVGAKQARLDAALAVNAVGNPNLDVVPGAASLVRAAVHAGNVPIKALRPLSPKLAAYAEERGDPSRSGLLEVARLIERHASTPDNVSSLVRRLRALADSDVHWDEVTSVERIPPTDPWVYDLTVADHHNFVAADLVVHNSNISEAVRWALGEQSAKSLRGHRMEDLIFHGSASRKPVGLAEVELTFGNDGTLSVPWSEIAVSRCLYRTGESEYLLNKSVCRLRDILDLFAGTGANPRAYSVMDQDKLNHVLTAKPHERRGFIEEAAGIARYKQQRNETQGKLEATRQNLVRVRDVMDEVRRQLGSLERQARRAQQYKALQAERRELALALLAADHAALSAEAERLAAELAHLADAEQAAATRLAGLAAREATERETIQASDHRLADLRQGVQKVQGELERLLERREQMGIQVRELTEEGTRLTDELRGAAERLEGIVAERESARGSLAEAERLAAERGAAARELGTAVEEHRAALVADRDRLEALRLAQIRIAAERVDLVREAGELRERDTQLARRAERLAAELAQAEAEAGALLTRRAELGAARERTTVELGSLGAERSRLAAALAETESRRQAAEGRLAEARLALAALRSTLEGLRQLEAAREGYGAGVRAIFTDGAARLQGVLGTVADLLEVPPGLERAVEGVLGERLQWVVVERFEHARAAVAYLSEHHAGSATFVPTEYMKIGGTESGPPNSPPGSMAGLEGGPHDASAHPDSGVRWIASRIGGRVASLVHHLLGRVALVDHLDEAEALWRKNGVVATYVTAAGEVLGPTGRLRGGAETPRDEHSLLARKRRLRELEDEVRGLEVTVENGAAGVAALGAAITTLRTRVSGLEDKLQARLTDRLTSEKDLEQAVREQERVERHRETVALESSQVAREAQETADMLARLDQRVATVAAAEARQETTMAAAREAIEQAQAREASLVAELTTCRVDAASALERLEALGRELMRLDQIEADLSERLVQGRQRLQQLGERRAWLGEERERTDTAAREVALDRDRLEDEARRAGEHHEGLVAALRGLESETRTLESERNQLTAAMHRLELAATEGRVRREELIQEAWRTWEVDAATLAAAHDPARDLPAVRERVGDIEEKLAAMGPVNPLADEEYRELDERLTFLRTQYDDLMASIKDLEKALRGMTRSAQDRFSQAFEEINRHFGRIFERLFEGGRAELRLVEAEEGGDPLDTGVELMAQPRGKRLQAVTLLSGGERALTGLALLFAIFYYRPSPFCVLDEVDAPLDDANIHRFLRVLGELTSQTQFLVITHNRKTMEAADVLYGITMEDPGLSKLVSVNLGE